MPNNYVSVLHKDIIQVENKNGLKVGGRGDTNTICPQSKRWGGALAPSPASYARGVVQTEFLLP